MRLNLSTERHTPGTVEGLWAEDRAPFFFLRSYTTQMAIDAQAELYGLEYTQQKSLLRTLEENDSSKHDLPVVLFLRSFESMRRLWVENAFEISNPDVLPFYSEPPRLTLESTLNRALAMRFTLLAVGGMFDAFGMARLHSGGHGTEDPFDFWKKDVVTLLSMARFVLLLPDSSPGLQWELEEIIRRDMINQTTFVMVPETVDPSARQQWDELLSALPKTLPDCPSYQPTGAFVFLPRDCHGYETLPFSDVYSGDLARQLKAWLS
jgi:hypothetical protein